MVSIDGKVIVMCPFCLLHGVPLGKCLHYCNVHPLYICADIVYVQMYICPYLCNVNITAIQLIGAMANLCHLSCWLVLDTSSCKKCNCSTNAIFHDSGWNYITYH